VLAHESRLSPPWVIFNVRQIMARKIEDWTSSPMPDPRKAAVLLGKLSDREVAVVGGAILDCLLADLVALGLRDDPKEVEDFVGLDADGRAPAGSFGARAQLAYLLGMIDQPTLRELRLIKDIRNLFSHHAMVSFADERVITKVKALVHLAIEHHPKRINPRKVYPTKEESKAEIAAHGFSRDACCGYFIGAVTSNMKLLIEACRRRKSRTRR
jgi:hypothetical protein